MSWLKEDVSTPDNFQPLCCGECTSAKVGCDVTMQLPSSATCTSTCGLAEGTEYAPAGAQAMHNTEWVQRMRHQKQKDDESRKIMWWMLIALIIISVICMVQMTQRG
jgi:hypothetical protein